VGTPKNINFNLATIGENMQHTYTLKTNNDFRRIYNRGKSFVSSGIVVYVTRNSAGYNRIGLTVGKKIGNAVKRNRAKRVMREAFISFENRLKSGYDIVLVARGKTVFIKSTEVAKFLNDLLTKAGILIK
jgi:ribonuclease P protein component